MKLQNIYMGLFLTALLGSCQKDQFSYELYTPSLDDIDSISFSPSSNTLIADGKATLSFVNETFRKVRVKSSSGVEKDTMLAVDPKMLPEGSVKIYANGTLLTGDTFKTTDLQIGTIAFQAKVGSLSSVSRPVKLRAKQSVPQAKTVQLIFHVLELDPKDAGYNALTYLDIDPKLLQSAVDKVNDVFNNGHGNDPNGGSMAIKFELATKNATGSKLQYAGYNKVIYNNSWKAYATATTYAPEDFKNKVNATATMKWNTQQFVNLYIIPLPASTNIGKSVPTYQMAVQGLDPIPGIPNIITDPTAVVATDFYETYGLGLPRNLFTQANGQVAEIASYLGKYYGLKSTNVDLVTDTDFCTDTRKYLGDTQVSNLIKIGIDGYKFVANNAMDDVRYPSLRNCFTVDQINRMQDVMKRSPVRQAYTIQP